MRTTPIDIAGLAKFIASPQDCQSIVVLTGAGISTASGIPDFRSVGGMYDTIRPELLTATSQQRQMIQNDPTQVVSWNMFRQNAFPYLEVRRPLILGTQQKQWKATIGHRFLELLHTKFNHNNNHRRNKLRRIYTQNIDGLDYQCTKIQPNTNIILPIHGTIREVSCEGCGTDMDYDAFCALVRTNIKDIYQTPPAAAPQFLSDDNDDKSQHTTASIPPPMQQSQPILCPNCQQPLVKPKTVLFGRSLPCEFFDNYESDVQNLDLLLMIGTSLVVSPANQLVQAVPNTTIRVVINNEAVGSELGIQYNDNHNIINNDDTNSNHHHSSNTTATTRDLFLQGDCDDILLQLMIELGWLDELNPDILPEQSAERVRKAQRDVAYTKWF